MEHNILESINEEELGARLRRERQRTGLTQAAAADVIGVARTTLLAIEQGNRRIRANELIGLARAYGCQVSDFVRPQPPVLSFDDQFRGVKVEGVTSDQLRENITLFEEVCFNYLALEETVGAVRRPRVSAPYPLTGVAIEQAAERIAIEERSRLGLGDGPIPQLRDILENDVGLRVFSLPFHPSEQIAGMYTYSEELGGCIASNSQQVAERRLWFLARAFAHFLTERNNALVLSLGEQARLSRGERFAQAFAEYFLMPTTGLLRRAHPVLAEDGRPTTAHLCLLADYYGVTAEAMTRRLERIHIIRNGSWDRISERHREVESLAESPATYRTESTTDPGDYFPKRYRFLAVYALDHSLISEGQFARYLRVDRLKARGIAHEVRSEMDGLSSSSLVGSEMAVIA